MVDKEKLIKVFAARLSELMHERGINVTKLAKLTNIPRSSISNWLILRRTPMIDVLCALADCFAVSTDYLLGREDL